MEPAAYLRRIGISGSAEASPEGLVILHEAHMASVPFENLDIHLGREIVMDEGRFLDKIVRQGRGGFCYELNGAFAWLLREVGFDVRYLSAGVFNDEGVRGPDFDHMALLVRVNGQEWIADVGFGDSFRTPLRFVADETQNDSDPRGVEYRLTSESAVWTMWKSGQGDWVPRYRFTLQSRELGDYAEMCRHQQTSPESSFTRRVVCSKTTPSGRITLTADTFIETTANGRTETHVSREEWHDVLAERFGVVLPATIVRWP